MDISDMLVRRGRSQAEAQHIAETMGDELTKELADATPVERTAILRRAVYDSYKAAGDDEE